MALIIGDEGASQGMSKAIYDKLRDVMEPIDGVSSEDLEKVRESWKKLAFAIATGVIEHMTSNMEIYGIQTHGNVNTSISGDTENTGSSGLPTHKHSVSLSGEQIDLELTQSNDGAGHVR